MKYQVLCVFLAFLLLYPCNAVAQQNNEKVWHTSDTVVIKGERDTIIAERIDYISNPAQNYFFQLHGGVSHSLSENVRFYPFFDAERPVFAFSFGKNFYPQFGMRLSLAYVNQVSYVDKNTRNNMPPGYEPDYTFKMGQVFLDGLFDLHSIFFGIKEKRRFNLSFILGLGYLRTFGFSDMATKWNDRYNELYEKYGPNFRVNKETYIDENGNSVTMRTYGYKVDTRSGNYFAGHLGLMATYKISDAWDINAEITFNGTDDAYNGVQCRRVYDAYVNAELGISYHIKDPQGSRRYRYSHYKENDRMQVINRTYIESAPPEKQTVEIIDYEEMLQTTIEFSIDKAIISDIQKENVYSVAAFMRSHPDVKFAVVGYADVQTAYPAYNMQLSRQRAENVYNMLIKECQIDPARLKVEWKGDTEQPYNLVNEWNRAVVFRFEK